MQQTWHAKSRFTCINNATQHDEASAFAFWHQSCSSFDIKNDRQVLFVHTVTANEIGF